MEGMDEADFLVWVTPQFPDGHSQETQSAACLLEVRNGRDLAVEGREQFRVEGVIRLDFLAILRPQNPLGEVPAMIQTGAVVVHVDAGSFCGRLPVNTPEQAVGHNGGDLRLRCWRNHPFQAGRQPFGFCQLAVNLLMKLFRFFAKGIVYIGKSQDHNDTLFAGSELKE